MNFYLDIAINECNERYKKVQSMDFISIGIVREDGKEYYAIRRDFDLRLAWKDDTLRETVLLDIYQLLYDEYKMEYDSSPIFIDLKKYSYWSMKYLLINSKRCKSRALIEEEVRKFCNVKAYLLPDIEHESEHKFYMNNGNKKWTMFQWLFRDNIPHPIPKLYTEIKTYFNNVAEFGKNSICVIDKHNTSDVYAIKASRFDSDNFENIRVFDLLNNTPNNTLSLEQAHRNRKLFTLLSTGYKEFTKTTFTNVK